MNFHLDDHPGPARRLSSVRARAMVDDALRAAAHPEDARVDHQRPASRRRIHAALVAAMMLLGLGLASASFFVAVRPAPRVTGELRPEAPVRSLQNDGAAPPEATIERVAEPVDRNRIEVHDSSRRRARTSAVDLLGVANRQRRDGRWADAYRTYRRLMSQYVGTNAAYVATLGAADILLRKLDRPAAAARMYQRAVRAGGALAEEARWGLAEAYQGTGSIAAELAALDDFLARHPDAPMAPRARARRNELSRDR